jgi:hypothetical protein
MTHTLSDQDIQEIANKAARTALAEAGLIKTQISTREAHKIYGRLRITRWRKLGLVNPVKQGGIIYWKVIELEKASVKNILQ